MEEDSLTSDVSGLNDRPSTVKVLPFSSPTTFLIFCTERFCCKWFDFITLFMIFGLYPKSSPILISALVSFGKQLPQIRGLGLETFHLFFYQVPLLWRQQLYLSRKARKYLKFHL